MGAGLLDERTGLASDIEVAKRLLVLKSEINTAFKSASRDRDFRAPGD